MDKEYILPYTISQVLAVVLLLISWKLPRAGRFLFALLFGWASWKNSTTVLATPEAYLDFGRLAIPLYAKFIRGWFSLHVTEMVLTIAAGQFMIAVGMLLKGWWVKAACIGAMLFLLAIAPLGVGAAFPCSVIGAIAAFLIYRKSPHNYLWEKNRISGIRKSV